jgi:HEAT repeats
MRLTLRTLLAWLDDTLPPAEVRQIGHQVTDSPFAQELVERIHRVTRQRRLTVPSASAADATDSNVVASYLDNEMSPELVAEYEKKCLTSDVHLAEVASAHQILSLIGQKAKVPAEARYRMYRLVKGREAVNPRVPRAFSPPPPDPLTEPLVPWAPPEPPARTRLERYGPTTGVIALILLLLWTTWKSLNPDRAARGPTILAQATNTTPTPAGKVAAKVPAVGDARKENAAGEAGSSATSKGETDASTETSGATKKAKDSSGLPAGSVGLVEESDGVLLRFNAMARVWERVRQLDALKNGDRLVSLERFRNPIELGSVEVRLVGETEINAHTPAEGLAAQFDLVRGRVVLTGPKPAAPIAVSVFGQKLVLNVAPGATVGLETINQGPSSPGLRLFAAEGDLPIQAGETKETLPGPGVVVFQAPDKFTAKEKRDAPSWVTNPSPPPLDKQIGESFARYFPADHRVMQGLVEAVGDPNKDVRQLAISALGAIGEVGVEEVISALGSQGDSAVRRAAIGTIRSLMDRGPEMAKAVHEQLIITFGDGQAETVEKLLTGFTNQEALEDATYTKLVQLLSSSDLAVRELALDDLQRMTGRDDHGFSADTPEGDGLKKWQDLLRLHELRPQTQPIK